MKTIGIWIRTNPLTTQQREELSDLGIQEKEPTLFAAEFPESVIKTLAQKSWIRKMTFRKGCKFWCSNSKR